MLEICKIDLAIYSLVTPGIRSPEVILTDDRINHIKTNHPGDYEQFGEYFSEILLHPDYVIRSKRPKTALVLKEIKSSGVKLILRLQTSDDPETFKNSILTFQRVNSRRFLRYIKNDDVVYRKKTE